MRSIYQSDYTNSSLVQEDNMFKHLLATLRNDDGATMVEYGIMVALIAAVCIVLISTLGKNVSTAFSSVNSSI